MTRNSWTSSEHQEPIPTGTLVIPLSGKDSPGHSLPEDKGASLTFLLSDSEEVEGCDEQGHQQGTHHTHRNEDTVPVVIRGWGPQEMKFHVVSG